MSKRLIEEVRRGGGELATESAAKTAVEAVTNAIQRLTHSGEKVTIRGFGTFQQKQRNARTGRNPRTGEPINIAARKQLAFKPAAKG